jgi:mannose-6-phosphate isomerase-like protein (cupin superfamily)
LDIKSGKKIWSGSTGLEPSKRTDVGRGPHAASEKKARKKARLAPHLFSPQLSLHPRLARIFLYDQFVIYAEGAEEFVGSKAGDGFVHSVIHGAARDIKQWAFSEDFCARRPADESYPTALEVEENAMWKVNLADKFAKISEYWKPYIAAELNGQHVKLDKLKGEFIFHHHENEDEMFLVVKGRFRMEFRDRHEWIGEGEFIVVPRGVEHRPVADEECWLLLFEPASTLNTGNVVNDRTVAQLERV